MEREKFKNNSYCLAVFCICCIMFWAICINWIYVLLVAGPFWYLYKKNQYKVFLASLIVSTIFLLYYVLIRTHLILHDVQNLLNLIFKCDLRDHLIKWINKQYNSKNASFVELLVFGYKNSSFSWDLYDDMNELNIVYLLSVSGFHLSFIRRIFKSVIKNKKVENKISCLIIFIYSYFLGFAVGSVRVLFTIIIKNLLRKYRFSKFEIISMSGLLTILLGPSCILNYGFCMSYLCTIYACVIHNSYKNNFFMEIVLINIACIFCCLPFVILMDDSINLLSLVFSIIFTFIFIPFYIFIVLTFYLPWFFWAINFLCYCTIRVVGIFQNSYFDFKIYNYQTIWSFTILEFGEGFWLMNKRYNLIN